MKTELNLPNLPKTEINLEIIVSEILRQIGIPPKLKGYGYLRKAIMIIINDSSCRYSIVRKVYRMIAEDDNTKDYCVERAIRNAIEIAWNRCNVDIVEAYFGYTVDAEKGRPTNSEFITTISDTIELKYSAFCK